MGVLSFSSEGIFEGFLGVQSVTFSAIDLFWRTFMTQAQRESSVQNIPADYNDIEMDADGFLFVTSSALDKTKQYNALVSGSTASDYAPVKRLNPSGDDILQRNGFIRRQVISRLILHLKLMTPFQLFRVFLLMQPVCILFLM